MTYCLLIALISMNLLIQSYNLVTNGWNVMKLIVIIYNVFGKGMWCTSKFITVVSDIQELMPFDCLHFNELVPTEP